MSEFSNIENVKGLLSLLDHYSLAKYFEEYPKAFATKGVQAIIKQKGSRPAAKHLLNLINQKPADVKAIANTFGLKDLGNPPAIKASQIWEKVLNSPADRDNLGAAMEKALGDLPISMSEATLLAFLDLLRILDLISNDKAFAQGKRPGAKVYQKTFNQMGTVPAIKQLNRSLTAQDRAELARLFGIKGDLSPKALMKKALPYPTMPDDLKNALCMVSPKECPKETVFMGFTDVLRETVRSELKEKLGSKKATKKETDAKLWALSNLIQFVWDNQALFEAYFKPGNLYEMTEVVLAVLEDKTLGPILRSSNSTELLPFYPKIRKKIKALLEKQGQ